jgi:DNA (cytosine-5)-methyltransferase 1
MGTGGNNVPLVAQALQTDGFLRSGSSFGTDKPQSSRNIRRLTPTECERLQGFPDGWTEGISDTQRYKTLGNAVTTNVIQFIGEHLSSLFCCKLGLTVILA